MSEPKAMTELEQYVFARSIEEGECWIWQLSFHHGHPQMGAKDRRTRTVRRELWETLRGPVPEGRCICCNCDNEKCVNPAHLVAMTRKQIGKRAASKGVFSGVTRRAKLADSKRKQGKLDWEKVHAIRGSDETLKVLAQRYGVAMNTVSQVRLGRRWVDFSSPFVALGAR